MNRYRSCPSQRSTALYTTFSSANVYSFSTRYYDGMFEIWETSFRYTGTIIKEMLYSSALQKILNRCIGSQWWSGISVQGLLERNVSCKEIILFIRTAYKQLVFHEMEDECKQKPRVAKESFSLPEISFWPCPEHTPTKPQRLYPPVSGVVTKKDWKHWISFEESCEKHRQLFQSLSLSLVSSNVVASKSKSSRSNARFCLMIVEF